MTLGEVCVVFPFSPVPRRSRVLVTAPAGARYHAPGQPRGGMLAQEHAITAPQGPRSVVLSDTAASFGAPAAEASKLRAGLPPEVEETLRRPEEASPPCRTTRPPGSGSPSRSSWRSPRTCLSGKNATLIWLPSATS
jgi:hypothetical protein